MWRNAKRPSASAGDEDRVGEVLAQLVCLPGHPVSNATTPAALNDRAETLPS